MQFLRIGLADCKKKRADHQTEGDVIRPAPATEAAY